MSLRRQRALRLLLRGRVQGVGFRYFTLRLAQRFGIVGRVRNLRDGSVEVLAAGPEAALARFRQELGQGPAGARVTGVEELELPDLPEWEEFEVTY